MLNYKPSKLKSIGAKRDSFESCFLLEYLFTEGIEKGLSYSSSVMLML